MLLTNDIILLTVNFIIMKLREKIFEVYKALRYCGVSAKEVGCLPGAYRAWLNNPFDEQLKKAVGDIYKALRHYGVSAEEIGYVVDGYRTWLDNPVDEIPAYGTVYYLDGMLYSMPYPLSELGSRFFGVEIGGTVYPADYLDDVKLDEMDARAETLKDKIFGKFFHADYINFKLRKPTQNEVVALAKVNWSGTKRGYVWIIPDPNQPGKQRMHVGRELPEYPKCRYANLLLVTRPEDLFVGSVSKYGVPTKKTEEVYKKLQKSLL